MRRIEATKLGDMVDEGLDKLDSATESTWNEARNLAAVTQDDDVDEDPPLRAPSLGAAAAVSADAEEVEALRASLRQAAGEIERLDDKQVSDAREEAEEARNDAKRFAMQAVARQQSKPAGAGDGPDPAPGGAGDGGAGNPAAALRELEEALPPSPTRGRSSRAR